MVFDAFRSVDRLRNPRSETVSISYHNPREITVDDVVPFFDFYRLQENIDILRRCPPELPDTINIAGAGQDYSLLREKAIESFDNYFADLSRNSIPLASELQFKTFSSRKSIYDGDLALIQNELRSRFLQTNKSLVLVSNSHATTHPMVKAVLQEGINLGLMIFDAHIDHNPQGEHDIVGKANFLRHLSEDNSITAAAILYTMFKSGEHNNVKIVGVEDARKRAFGRSNYIDESLSFLSDRGVSNILLSFDVDCLNGFKVCSYSAFSYLVFLAAQDFRKYARTDFEENYDVLVELAVSLDVMLNPIPELKKYFRYALPKYFLQGIQLNQALEDIKKVKLRAKDFGIQCGVQIDGGCFLLGDVVEYEGLDPRKEGLKAVKEIVRTIALG